ncbi:MAG TPA: succinate dehydrogenase cytochrome b subunit [Gemmatimonadales bacterium]|jgi:succinate dehydrogenase / fumarate reductase cytochrome b subunit|nr:succinate dehydrogenase cytochrome b subunit [Gemmatimonadales bacterium]
MSRVTALTHTLVGKKVVMAVSGVILMGFVLGHMVGNLKVFQGPEHFDAYAEGLRTVGAPLLGRGQLLWAVRLVLIVAVVLHIAAAWAVTRASWAARPQGYHALRLVETTYAARTMRWGAVIILLFVIFHLLDLTFGRMNPSFLPGDPYHNVIATFGRVPVALGYIVAMGALCLHLYHGIESACQTLGLNHPRYNVWRRRIALGFSLVVAGGFIAVPIAVLAGVVR